MLGRRHHRTSRPLNRTILAPVAHLALALALFFVVSVVATAAVHAQTQPQTVNVGLQFASASGLTTVDIRTVVSRIIRYFFALLGLITVVLIMYAGFQWMTAAGNDEKIAQAKKILINAVIGLFIIISAYAIVAFFFQGITGQPIGGAAGRGAAAPPCFGLTCSVDRHSDALGNGIIQYHYPEPNQKDVPRNTKIAITFKKPLALGSVFRNYDDKGTYDAADDKLCGAGQVPPKCDQAIAPDAAIELNTDVIKIIPNEQLQTPAGGTLDEQFAARYAQALANGGATPAVTAKVTPIDLPFNPLQGQTIVIRPAAPIGSSTKDMDYRVALRGSDGGIRVWSEGNQPEKPKVVDAFTQSDADGAYFWIFTTNTTIDTTPPKITAVVPGTKADPATDPLDRNQLLQMYFDEAVDPTSASGVIGAGVGGGFTKMEVKAKCLTAAAGQAAIPCDPQFKDAFVSVPGTLVIGNRYKTVEFTPSTPCENVSENSCGDPVFCLPKNVELRLVAKAATVGADAPLASSDDGVEDMVGNSLDGNRNGKTEGPATQDSELFSLNIPPSDVGGIKDSARAIYQVGDTVDLVPPAVLDTDPKSASPDGNPSSETAYAAGPSKFPPDNPIGVLWNKTISITSIRTGDVDDKTSTVVLQSKECRKAQGGAGSVNCPVETDELPKPYYFIDTGVPETVSGAEATRMKFIHRAFLSANDLGYTDADIAAGTVQIPKYAPLLRAQLRDTKQNCFFPSVGAATYSCSGAAGDKTSCCNRLGQADPTCPP